MLSAVTRIFNLAILNPTATSYMEALVESALDEREKNTEGCDLLQTMKDNMVEVPADMIDASGFQWTKQGNTYILYFFK